MSLGSHFIIEQYIQNTKSLKVIRRFTKDIQNNPMMQCNKAYDNNDNLFDYGRFQDHLCQWQVHPERVEALVASEQ